MPIIAMASAEGGTIIVGLAEGAVSPVSDDTDNSLRQAAIDFTRPTAHVRVRELHTTSGRVLVFTISPSDHVHENTKGETFQRIGHESRRLSFSQRQELEWDRGAATFEGTAAPGVEIIHLSPQQLEAYQHSLGSRTPEATLRARDLLTIDGKVTVAGYLLFADRPQVLYPSTYIRVLKYASNERGTGRTQSLEHDGDIRCEGSLPEQIVQAERAVEALMPVRRALGESGRFETIPIIPKDVWLEGVVNAVVHRSYSIGGDHIRVELFPNRVEITSPGRFPGIADPEHPESIGRHARNPRIARVLADLGITQGLGEGIRRMFAEMRRVGLSDPMYIQTSESVRLALLSSNAVPEPVRESLGAGTMKVLDAMRLVQRPLGTGQITELVGQARPTVLRHLRALQDAGYIQWEGESLKDPRATWHVV